MTQHRVFSKVAVKYIFIMPNRFGFIFEIAKASTPQNQVLAWPIPITQLTCAYTPKYILG